MAESLITPTGFDKPTLPELVQGIGDDMSVLVGPVNLNPDSATGQWIGIGAEQQAIAMETLQSLYLSRSIAYAEGLSLDAIGDWLQVPRNPQTFTTVPAVLYGSESVPVPAGAVASMGSHQFALTADAVISRASLVDGAFSVNDATQASYTVRVNGVDKVYARLSTDTAATIATALALLVDGTDQYNSSATGSTVNLTSENNVQGYPVSLTAGLVWTRIGSPGLFQALDAGAVVVPVGTLNNPSSAVSGWTGVSNLVAGNTGTERESDTEYRARLLASRAASKGAATVPAIESRLRNEVPGVTLAICIENDTLTAATNGQTAKSINCIVAGGDEQAVANAIWKYKGASVATWGSTSLTVRDDHGQPHTVSFSRTTGTNIWVKVNVTLLDSEEALESDVIADIKQGVLNYGATLSLGDDVITQRIYGYIYGNTSGIGKMTVTVSTDGAAYSENNITIATGAAASFADARIEVTGV